MRVGLELGATMPAVGYPKGSHTLNKTLGVFALLVLIVSCESKSPPLDQYKFLEYVAVQGECREDHVTESAHYEGSILHSFNVSKDRHEMSGSVTNNDFAKFESSVLNPYKYYPPFSVTFSGLAPVEISQDKFMVQGLSVDIRCGPGRSASDCHGPQYETHCSFIRTKRLESSS
jgi:hypothetical protein